MAELQSSTRQGSKSGAAFLEPTACELSASSAHAESSEREIATAISQHTSRLEVLLQAVLGARQVEARRFRRLIQNPASMLPVLSGFRVRGPA